MTGMHVICEGAGRRHNQYGCHSGCKTRSLSGVKDDMEADKRFALDCFQGPEIRGQKNNSRVNLLCFQNRKLHAGCKVKNQHPVCMDV